MTEIPERKSWTDFPKKLLKSESTFPSYSRFSDPNNRERGEPLEEN